jgi:hypothetical protein
MPLSLRRLAAALAAVLLLCPPAKADYDVRMSSFREGFYRLYGVGVLLDMPSCMRPCAQCAGRFETDGPRIVFAERACAVERAYRVITPMTGRSDLVLRRRGRDLYVSDDLDWLFETEGCAVEGGAIETRVVIDNRANRLLMTAPDHPDASITGRVGCAIRAVHVKVTL